MKAGLFASCSASWRLCVTMFLALLGMPLFAAPPAWWTGSGTRIFGPDPTPVPDNYAPANLGQLKNVAKQAKAHLDANLLGKAGPTIDALVKKFQDENVPADNYAPINLGQLKVVAKPYYDRLLSAGYDTRANLIAHGYPGGSSPWAFYYPWDPNTPVSENYAPANLGQLKIVFSFEASGLVAEGLADSDNDGLPDWWEASVAGGTSGGTLGDWNNDGIKNVSDLVAGVGSSAISEEGLTPTSLGLKIYTLLAL